MCKNEKIVPIARDGVFIIGISTHLDPTVLSLYHLWIILLVLDPLLLLSASSAPLYKKNRVRHTCLIILEMW